jgi:hypothetical protein
VGISCELCVPHFIENGYMYTEKRSLNNETMALVADTTAQSSLAFAETTRVNKPTLQIGSTGQSVAELQQLLYH